MIVRLEPQIRQSDYAEGMVYSCHKCKFWNKLIQSPLGEGLFIKTLGKDQKDSIPSSPALSSMYGNLINDYQDGWLQSWYVQAEIWLTEHNFTEQIFSAKLWNFLTQVLRKNQVTKTMCDSHIKMKSVFVFNVEQQVHKFEADIKRLYKECNKIVEKGNIKDIKETLTENDSICTVGMSANKAMLDKLKSISVDFPLIAIGTRSLTNNKLSSRFCSKPRTSSASKRKVSSLTQKRSRNFY